MEEQNKREDYFSSEYDCEMCHSAPRDRSENPASRLCRSCREKSIRYPVPKKIWVAAVVVFVLLTVAMVRFPKVLESYKVYSLAETRIRQGELYETLDDLLATVEEFPDSTVLSGRLALLAYEYGAYDYCAYTIDTFLVGKDVSDSLYWKLDNAMNKLDKYYTTIDSIQTLGADLDENLSPEQVTAQVKSECEALLKDEEQDQSLVYYYLAMLSEKTKDQEQYLTKCLELDPVMPDANASLGTVKRRLGNLEGAEECYGTVLSLHNTNTSALRGRGILKMLKGDMEEGLADIRYAYEIYPDTTYLRETYMIALALTGDETGSRQIRQEILDLGQEIEEDTQKLLSGEITLNQYYIGE